MANPDDIASALTLKLEPDRIPVAAFDKIVSAFVKSLDEIAKRACGNAKAVQWEISVDTGSVQFEAGFGEATSPGAASSVRSFIDNDPETVRDSFVPPRGMPPACFLVGTNRVEVGVAHFGSVETQARAEHNVFPPFEEYGTIEGELELMDRKPPRRFLIREPIWDKRVQCRIPDDLVAKMPAMWGQRVAAHGLIRYNAEGRPERIEAEKVEPFPYDETPIEAFRGILAKT